MQKGNLQLGLVSSPRHQGRELQVWLEGALLEVGSLVRVLHSMDPLQWWSFILEHPAHRHHWYQILAEEGSRGDFAEFFFENQGAPSFVELVRRTLPCQITEEGKAAVRENLLEEETPLPHRKLMRKLMETLRGYLDSNLPRPGETVKARQNVLHAGYELEPWQLVGSLFAIECMGSFRMTQMERGLRRLGFSKEAMKYVSLHTTCDEHHAADWCHRVILGSLEVNPRLRSPMIHGIALVLEMDRRYLEEKVKIYRKRTSAKA